jgi:hypothetical protein
VMSDVHQIVRDSSSPYLRRTGALLSHSIEGCDIKENTHVISEETKVVTWSAYHQPGLRPFPGKGTDARSMGEDILPVSHRLRLRHPFPHKTEFGPGPSTVLIKDPTSSSSCTASALAGANFGIAEAGV